MSRMHSMDWDHLLTDRTPLSAVVAYCLDAPGLDWRLLFLFTDFYLCCRVDISVRVSAWSALSLLGWSSRNGPSHG